MSEQIEPTGEDPVAHSPTPWHVVLSPEIDDDIEPFREVLDASTCLVAGAINEVDARRICAAVNAVQNIPTAALEAGVVNRLLTACEAALADLCAAQHLRSDDTVPLLRKVVRAARGPTP